MGLNISQPFIMYSNKLDRDIYIEGKNGFKSFAICVVIFRMYFIIFLTFTTIPGDQIIVCSTFCLLVNIGLLTFMDLLMPLPNRDWKSK